jgi:hypothetical protein
MPITKPKRFDFRSTIERWMASALIVPDVRRMMFIRKFHTLLVARGADWNRKALQSAMHVLLKFQEENYPARKTSRYLSYVTLACGQELIDEAVGYTVLSQGNEDYSCPGHCGPSRLLVGADDGDDEGVAPAAFDDA